MCFHFIHFLEMFVDGVKLVGVAGVVVTLVHEGVNIYLLVFDVLQLLEGLVRAGGETVHAVVGKFRFLNELIKLVSPKVRSSTVDAPLCRI